mgnify:FL=1|tara:strand:- start:83 stop:322 length:240 start_codon:yes stop_codon:yes gene_type:complete
MSTAMFKITVVETTYKDLEVEGKSIEDAKERLFKKYPRLYVDDGHRPDPDTYMEIKVYDKDGNQLEPDHIIESRKFWGF